MLKADDKQFKAPLIAGRVVGFSELSPVMRRVDLLIVESFSTTIHPVKSHDIFVLERKDLIDPEDWNNIDGHTIVHGLVQTPREQDFTRSLVLPHSKAQPQQRPKALFSRLSNVVFVQDSGSSGGGGGLQRREQPQMERVLPYLRHGK